MSISGMLVFLAACILMLVVAVIVWRPKDAGLYAIRRWKRKYRPIGKPLPLPKYMKHDKDPWTGYVISTVNGNLILKIESYLSSDLCHFVSNFNLLRIILYDINDCMNDIKKLYATI